MSIPVCEARRPESLLRRSTGVRQSVREVCLVGGHPDTPAWTAGGRIEHEGRSYRVASLQVSRSSARTGPYAHLVPEVD